MTGNVVIIIAFPLFIFKLSLSGNPFFQPPCALALLLCAWRLFRGKRTFTFFLTDEVPTLTLIFQNEFNVSDTLYLTAQTKRKVSFDRSFAVCCGQYSLIMNLLSHQQYPIQYFPFIENYFQDLLTRVRDNILKSKEQKNIPPTKGGHKMVTCQNYVSLFYCQITSCPSDGGIS